MNVLQKVIKYCAMGFAVFLSVVIFVSIAAAAFGVVSGVTIFSDGDVERVNIEKSYTVEEAKKLGIEEILVDCSAEITIGAGEKITVSAENVPEEYVVSCKDGKLVVRDTRKIVFSLVTNLFEDQSEKEQVTITIPKDYALEKATIDSGSGTVFVLDLTAKDVTIDSGSGEVLITDVTAENLFVDSGSGKVNMNRVTANTTEIESGSGKVVLKDSVLGPLQLDSGSGAVEATGITAEDVEVDSGSGRVSLEGKLTGNCEFETGSGSLTLSIQGYEEDYRIKADCGSGAFRINGKKLKDGSYGSNKKGELKIDSGSGSVNVEFLAPVEE